LPACLDGTNCLLAQIDKTYVSKLEETLTKDNKRMQAAEKRADALTWDIHQAKEGKKVRVR
jgi:hypothetical protein